MGAILRGLVVRGSTGVCDDLLIWRGNGETWSPHLPFGNHNQQPTFAFQESMITYILYVQNS